MSVRYSAPFVSLAIGIFTLALAVAAFFTVTGGLFYVYKNVQVWSASQSGQAVLAEAEFSRRVRIEEARAKDEAAKLEGQAELTRAQFSAKANAELAEGLGGADGYLRYLYIEMLREQGSNGKTFIYVPTEAGLPILEAGRMVGQ